MPFNIYKNSEGARVPGVTTIIGYLGFNKRALMYWAWNEGCEGRDYKESSGMAASAGTLAHHFVESAWLNKDPFMVGYSQDVITKAETAFANYEQWAEEVKLSPIYTEHSVISEAHQYGGQIDCLGYIRGNFSLLDLKTGKGPYIEQLMQVVAYAKAWNETAGPEFILDDVYLVRFPQENASFHHHKWGMDELEPCWEAFLHARELYGLKKEMGKLL